MSSSSLERAFGSKRFLLEWLSLYGLLPWGNVWQLTIWRKERYAFWIGVICASVMVKLLTIYYFIVQLLWGCGIWFLVYLEFVGLCQHLLLSFLLADKVDLVAIVIDIYGLLFHIVWCGAFGRKEIVGVLKTVSVLCLISSFYFSEPYWTGSHCVETNFFLQFWIYLIYVIFVFDMYTPVYSLCTWLSFFIFYFLYINKSLLLIYIYKALQLANGMHPCVTINRQGSAYCSHLL